MELSLPRAIVCQASSTKAYLVQLGDRVLPEGREIAARDDGVVQARVERKAARKERLARA